MTANWTQAAPPAQLEEQEAAELQGLRAQIKSSKARTEAMTRKAIGLESNFNPGLEAELAEIQAKFPPPAATVRGVEGGNILKHSIMLEVETPIGPQSVFAPSQSILCTNECLSTSLKERNPSRAVHVVTPETLASLKEHSHVS